MDSHSDNIKKKPLFLRILDWIDYIVIGLVLLIVALLCIATLWLTPARLSDLIDRQASERLNADVSTGDVSFTIWSSFPHLRVVADSIHVRSRNLDSIPADVRRRLPADPAFLLSTGRVSGGINLAKLISGQFWLRDVNVDSLRLNLVAVNDSLNNYNIVPSSGNSKIPYFNIDSLRFVDGGKVSYFSLLSKTDASVSLSDASLLPRVAKDDYHLMFRGKVFARSDGLALLRDFPFELDGDVHLRFKPFGVSTSDYQVSLGEVDGRMGLDLDLGNDVKLNNFDYRLSDFTLEDLRSLLPPGDYPVLSRLQADVQLDATARLTSPYDFSSGFLPSIEVDFSVPDGKVGYTFNDNEKYTVNNVGLAGRFVFNGTDPDSSFVEIPDLHLKGLGADINVRAYVSRLTSRPRVDLAVKGHGDLTSASCQVRALKPYRLSGAADFDADMSFTLDGSTLSESSLTADVKARKLGLRYGGYDFDLKGFAVSTDESCSSALSQNVLLNDIPVDVKISADNAKVSDLRNEVSYAAAGLKADGRIGRTRKGDVMRRVDLHLKGDKVSVKSKGTGGDLGHVDMDLSASRLSRPVKTKDFVAPAVWTADAVSMNRVAHTPEFIRVSLPDNVRKFMAEWKTGLRLKVGRGELALDGYPASVKGLDLAASFDSLVVRNVELTQGDTRAVIKARLGNLRQFLNSSVPAPLLVDADIRMDTVQINQLARAYTASHPNSAIARGDKEAMAAGVDTVAMILPRNVYARLHASAMQTRYINLHLYDLMTDITLADGRANIDTLHISSDFGKAALDMVYDTSDLQDLKMRAGLDVYDVNVVSFFQNFHKLLLMMPEMKNLSGVLSARVDGRLHIFPSMYVNLPSLWANAFVEGVDLKVKQNKFIRHVTSMLLIPDDGVLDIADIKVHAGVHSNLLEVFPFTFEISNYKLLMQGLNNFNGDMYYHIGVEDWPLKLPFGVNIKGQFHHPVLRFGGKEWKDRNGAMITGGVQDYDRFNLVREARRYAGEFIHTAATYEE